MGGYVVRAGDGGIVFRYQQYLAKNVLQFHIIGSNVYSKVFRISGYFLCKLASFSFLTKFEIA